MAKQTKKANNKRMKPKHYSDLKHEDQLCNNRLTWLIVLQGFLLTAYSQVATAKEESFNQARKVQVLVWISKFGCWSAFGILIGILAACYASYFIYIDDIEDPKYAEKDVQFGIRTRTTLAAWVPIVGIPVLFVLAWYKLEGLAPDV